MIDGLINVLAPRRDSEQMYNGDWDGEEGLENTGLYGSYG